MEDQKPSRPMSRLRRLTGLVLLALGFVLIAWVAWLGAFYHAGFGDVEWIRFFGMLTIGIWLALAGGWLAYRSRVAAWTLVLSVTGLLLAGLAHDLWWR